MIMKKLLFFAILISMAGCCKDFYIAPVSITILKDNRPLSTQNIFPTFFYVDENGKENVLHYEGADSAIYLINQSSDLERLSFRPQTIFIRYNKLLKTDTLEILLDYACNEKSRCSCSDIVLKHMKYKENVLKDHTIRK